MSDIEIVELDCTPVDSTEQIPETILPDVPSPVCSVEENPVESDKTQEIKCESGIDLVDNKLDTKCDSGISLVNNKPEIICDPGIALVDIDESVKNETNETKYKLPTFQVTQDASSGNDDDIMIHLEGKAGKIPKRKSQITDDDIQNLIVKCSACGRQVNHNYKANVKKHRHLGVLICKECYHFYSEGEFSEDDTGYNYCRWCAQGGKLYGCDFCPNTFCFKCVHRNFGRGEARRIQDQKWKCYLCEPSVLKEKILFCDVIIKYAEKVNEKKKKFSKLARSQGASNQITSDSEDDSSVVPSKWLPFHINRVIFLCSKLQKRMLKLKHKHGKNEKSTKQVVAKFSELIDICCSEIRGAQKVVQNKYNHYVQYKQSAVEKENFVPDSGNVSEEVINISDDGVKPKEKSDGVILNGIMEDAIVEKVLGSKMPEDVIVIGDCLNDLNTCERDLTDAEKTVNGHVKKGSTVCKGGISDAETEPNQSHDDDSQKKDDGNCKNQTLDERTKELEEDNGDCSPVQSQSLLVNFSLETEITHNSGDPSHNTKSLTCNVNSAQNPIDELLERNKAAKQSLLSEMLDSDSDDHSPVVPEDDVHSKSDEDYMRSPRNKKPLRNGKKYKGVKSKEQSSEIKHHKNSSSAKLSGSNLSSSSSSDIESDPRTTKSKNSKQQRNKISVKQSSLSKDSASIKNLLKLYADEFGDPKLLMHPRIYLEKLLLTLDKDPDLNKSQTVDVEEGVDPDDSSGSEENFDKTFRKLACLPKRKKKNISASESDHQGSKPKKPAQKKTKKGTTDQKDDSCSDPFTLSSSSGEEESKKMKLTNKSMDLISLLDKNELAKASLLDTKISSSDSSDSDIYVSPKKFAKTKTAHKKDESGSSSVEECASSDDFRLPKKKGKYDKLLKAQISERNSDSGQKEKHTNRTKEKKQAKRKVISSDEDGSKSKDNRDSSSSDSTGSDSGDFKTKRGKNQDPKSKKRKRIKVANSSNSDTGRKSDEGVDGGQGKSRKNIRKIVSRAEETKEAAQAEKERRKRVADRQRLYNQITEVIGDHGEMITKKMVLEVDPDSKEEVVEIHPDIVEKLKPHQINGVKFMWECTIESLKQLKSSKGSGCILAHCMGLGKTLQVIAFLYTIFANKFTKEHFKTALVICPYNTVLNWAKEFEIWLEDAEETVNIFEMAAAKDNYTRKDVLQMWQDDGGVLIIGYDIFRRLVEGKMARANKKLKEKVYSLLVDPGPDIVVCDEGHILKNETSAISKATSKLRTQRRIVLTGTPLQNNLKEYHCMLHFVKPHLLGTAKEFNNRFVNPIMNGQCADSSEYDVKKMKKRVHILHKLLQGCVQRCDYSALKSFLPDKHEFVISVKLSDVQIKMYSYFLERLTQVQENGGKVDGRQLFKDYNSLKNIWTHPFLVEKSYIRYRDAQLFVDNDSEGSLADFIDDDSSASSKSSGTDDEVKLLEDDKPSTSKGKGDNSSGDEIINKWKTRSRSKRGEGSAMEDDVPSPPEEKHWWNEFFSEDDNYKLELSGKMVLVFEILKECELIGDKVLLFSTSLLALNLLEELLQAEDEKFQIACQNKDESSACQDYIGSWSLGLDYFRMDGSTNIENRKRWIDIFNDKDNERARLFMISTKAGSLGTNLTGANRVIMLDASWNPSHDVQAIFRVYRFGQEKPVYIYRLLAQGTMEEKIYDRQVTKLSLQCRVIDEQNIERHFNASDLRELYKFDPEGQSNRPTPMVPKDRLLAELLIKHKNWIVTYHEHDSLLQNITEDDLTEEERQTAWQEYENEREGIMTGNPLNAKAFNFDPNVDYELPDADKDVKRCVEYIKSKNPGAGPEHLLNKGIVAINNLQRHYGEVLNRIRNERLRLSQLGPVPEKMDNYIGALMTAIEKSKSYTNQLRQQYYQFCLAKNVQMKAQQAQKLQQWNAQQAQKQQQQQQRNAQQRDYSRANVGSNTFLGRPQVYMNVPRGPQTWQQNMQRFSQPPQPQGVKIVQVSSTPGVGPSASAGTSSSKDSGPIITEVVDVSPAFDQGQSRPHTRSSASSSVTITELD